VDVKVAPSPGLDHLMAHAKVYATADKYLIKRLKTIACRNFRNCLQRLFACDAFYETIKAVLEVIPDRDSTLRHLIVKRIYREKKHYGLKKHRSLQSALENIPRLAYWVMMQEEG
jgi:hypothetical protein